MIKIYIDEAGRGPLAGPLHMGLVLIIDKKINKKSFKDSKILTERQREKLFQEIQELQSKGKIKYTIGISNNKEIDKYGMTRALNLAISRGVYKLLSTFCCSEYNKGSNKNKICYQNINEIMHSNCHPEGNEGYNIKLIIDGNRTFGVDKDLGIQVETIVDGDAKIPEIGMASIIAKVSRDNRMKEVAAKKHKKYVFEKHKGYGTKFHKEIIEKNGICAIHRKLFLKRIYPDHKIKPFRKNTKFVL